MKAGVLYLSYSGMLEPLGQSQVLAYQEVLATDHEIHLISFERGADWARIAERDAIAARMLEAGISWYPLRYHKRLSLASTAWDVVAGATLGATLARRHKLEIVHARSYVAAAMALWIKRRTGTKFLFDMRGFWADERVDGGIWSHMGVLHRLAKWFERRFLLTADYVVSLTRAAVLEMERFPFLRDRRPPMVVIPTCADLSRFQPSPAPDGAFCLGYVGSVGTWYLFDPAVEAFKLLCERRPDAKFLILNRGAHAFICQRLKAAGVPAERVELRAANYEDVPAQMSRMHAAVFFIKPVFSKQASAPTKLAEFLGCGIPCLSNSGVGDMAEILRAANVGIAVDNTSPETLAVSVDALLALCSDPGVRERCVRAARTHYSLDEGVRRYRDVYAALEKMP